MNVHARLLVDDYEGCFRFYHEVLGLTVTWGDETSGYADFSAGEGSFSLFVRAEMEMAVSAPPELTGGLERDRVVVVLGVPDLDGTVEGLRKRGVNFLTDVADQPGWGIRVAHLRDPDGNLVELNAPLGAAPSGGGTALDAHGVQGDAG